MAIEASESFGGKDYKFVTSETVYEMTDAGPQELDDGGDSLLESLGHDPAAREAFRAAYHAKDDSFKAEDYWAKYMADNNYETEATKSAESTKSGSTVKTTTKSRTHSKAGPKKTSAAAKKPSARTKPAAELAVDEEIENQHPELSDEIKAFIARLVQEEVAKALKPLQEENQKLKKEVRDLKQQLADAQKEPKTKPELSAEEKAEEDRLAGAAGSPWAIGDRLKVDDSDEVLRVQSKPWKDTDGDWRLTMTDKNGFGRHFKINDLNTWNPPVRTAPAAPPASTPAAPAAPAAAAPAAEVRKPRGWFGRRMMTDEEYTVYETNYQKRNRAAAIGAAVLAILGGAWVIWQTAETEDIEATVHRIEANQHAPVRKVIIEKRKEPSSNNPTTTTEQPPATTTQEPSTTTTQSTTTESQPPTTTTESSSATPAAPAPPETTPDNDEPLSGNNSYFGNFNQGGHGMGIGYPKGTVFRRNPDGTATITLRDGSVVALHWKSSNRFTQDTINELQTKGYEVGTTTGSFADREGNTYTHVYSVIGDRD